MNELHYQRIDKGIKRQMRAVARRQAQDEKGKFLPICSVERRAQIIQALPAAIKSGETTKTIAEREGIAWSTLKSWIVGDETIEEARGEFLAQQLVEYADRIDQSRLDRDPLALACAREGFRAWSWIAERREARLFGQKQEVKHTGAVTVRHIEFEASAADLLRVIEGECTVEPAALPTLP